MMTAWKGIFICTYVKTDNSLCFLFTTTPSAQHTTLHSTSPHATVHHNTIQQLALHHHTPPRHATAPHSTPPPSHHLITHHTSLHHGSMYCTPLIHHHTHYTTPHTNHHTIHIYVYLPSRGKVMLYQEVAIFLAMIQLNNCERKGVDRSP